MTEKRLFVVSAVNRPYLHQQIDALAIGDQVRIGPADRRLVQNAKFHAMCGDIAKQVLFVGRSLAPAQWKVLLISAHATETGEKSDVVQGLSGEFVNLRESSAEMSIARMASLIEYVTAWAAQNNVRFTVRNYLAMGYT